MRMSSVGRHWLEGHECVGGVPNLHAYQDTKGIWTIGYGHTGKEVHHGMIITAHQADEIFEKDLQRFEEEVTKNVKPLMQREFDACVSLAFNIGVGGFHKSRLRDYLNSKWHHYELHEIAARFSAWAHPPELLSRRLAEVAVFWHGDYSK